MAQNKDLERLKQKYQPALTLMQQLQVQLQNVNMEGSKLLIRGVAPSADIKNRVWDQVKLIDSTLFRFDLRSECFPGTAGSGNHDDGCFYQRSEPAALYRQARRYSFQNQPAVLRRRESVHRRYSTQIAVSCGTRTQSTPVRN